MFEAITVDALTDVYMTSYFETESFVGGGQPVFGEFRVIVRFADNGDFIDECYPSVYNGEELDILVDLIAGVGEAILCTINS